jgi:hypothetical protein
VRPVELLEGEGETQELLLADVGHHEGDPADRPSRRALELVGHPQVPVGVDPLDERGGPEPELPDAAELERLRLRRDRDGDEQQGQGPERLHATTSADRV